MRYQGKKFSESEVINQSAGFLAEMKTRRSIRDFSDRPVPREVMENLIMAAATAPSGANKQPWTFCLIGSPDIKQHIREAAEKEEYDSYHGRMSESWLKDLAPLGTDWRKPFLETAPWLIVVFKKIYDLHPNGEKHNHYYVTESVGIACGMLITAIHQAGLCTLTHTPSPMNFLTKILNRPENERPFLLLPVGYPADDCWVPDIARKSYREICAEY